MSDIVIKVENLSKQYQLGVVGTGTLRSDLQRWYHRIRGKEDPTLKIGQENILSATGNRRQATDSLEPHAASRTPDFVWALRDINFEVRQGEVLGIIGKNGAGKSTLLKILSQVTSPTTGSVKVKGRIASLLEVGTGFHPELTGRENIFLNGAILGMTKSEIRSKFDEIVDFSGIENYIDTPVKRYSSGMYVRLAFAVAAHLEPEILVVDEVLAVGDAEFQKKALGKMQDVSTKDGRTVLFVSHNMNAVNRLCQNAMILRNGQILKTGIAADIVNNYLTLNDNNLRFVYRCEPEIQPDKEIELLNVEVNDGKGLLNRPIEVTLEFFIDIRYKLNKRIRNPNLVFHLKNKSDEYVLLSDIKDTNNIIPSDIGIYSYTIRIPQPLLKPDHYFLSLGIMNMDTGQTNHFPQVLNFEIVDNSGNRFTRAGYIYIPLNWQLNKD